VLEFNTDVETLVAEERRLHTVNELARPKRVRFARLERAMDVVAASILLLVTAPLMAIVAILVRAESPGPAIYRGRRLGLAGQPFTVFKFRSMRTDTDDELHRRYVLGLLRAESKDHQHSGGSPAGDNVVAFKLQNDPRVTRVGRWIRATTLDELPQLVNVLRGEMSLVGPRPEVPYALEGYEAWQHERFSVRPGLTGLWQVSGRGDLSPREMLALDVEYARRRSLRLYVAIVARTIPAVLQRKGAS
jgi:lipopolysaccharide/colanic/teichoic acid biosynthesis glycosyltransferase